MMRTFNDSIRQSLDDAMREDPSVILLGLGITDPKRFFGTTGGLLETHGAARVLECPTSENAYLGHALGLALRGLRPVVHFQRMDFLLYALDQLVNNVAKWRDMLGVDRPIPLVVRALVGMGWGQGAQHSQNLAPWLAQIPGLQVVAPSCPASAYHLLHASLRSGAPTLFVEHRWLQYLQGPAPLAQDAENWSLGRARIRRPGSQVTIASWSYGTAEALRFCAAYPEIDWEIIDLLSLAPLDAEAVRTSYRKTGRLAIWEPAWSWGGVGAELLAGMQEAALPGRACRIGYPRANASASPREARDHYPTVDRIVDTLNRALELGLKPRPDLRKRWPVDQDPGDWSPWTGHSK